VPMWSVDAGVGGRRESGGGGRFDGITSRSGAASVGPGGRVSMSARSAARGGAGGGSVGITSISCATISCATTSCATDGGGGTSLTRSGPRVTSMRSASARIDGLPGAGARSSSQLSSDFARSSGSLIVVRPL
jgi:hypothetical protein